MNINPKTLKQILSRPLPKPLKSKQSSSPEVVEKDIKNYYKRFNLTKVKNPKNVENELLYQLYKRPKETVKIKMEDTFRDDVQQVDLLYLPHDGEYKYAIVAVDVGSRFTDAEPLKSRTAKATIDAMKTIYSRKILNMPNTIVLDSGSEFKKEFQKYFKDNNVSVVVSQPNRHRQTGLVESRNKSIGTYLLKRQTAQELVTGSYSREWIDELQKIIKQLNKRFGKKTSGKVDDSKELFCKGNTCDLLDIGDLVRYPLDHAINVVDNKRLDSKFRASDIRYSLKPTKIRTIRTSTVNPPLYGLEGKTALYSRETLLPVDESKLKLPPASTQKKFIIERIIDKKKIKGLVHYLIKWKGYNDSHNTWEPRKQLISDVPEMVKEFEKSLK